MGEEVSCADIAQTAIVNNRYTYLLEFHRSNHNIDSPSHPRPSKAYPLGIVAWHPAPNAPMACCVIPAPAPS